MALEHALNRQSFGGQYNALWKIAMAAAELSRSDASKDALAEGGLVNLLSRLLDMPPDRQVLFAIDACLVRDTKM